MSETTITPESHPDTPAPLTAEHPTPEHPTVEHPTPERRAPAPPGTPVQPKTSPGIVRIARHRARARGARLWHRLRRVARRDDGMTTAEYAVGTVAAVAFGGVLYKVVTSDAVSSGLSAILEKALNATF